MLNRETKAEGSALAGDETVSQLAANIPKTVSQRLSRYLRVLQELSRRGQDTISSQALGRKLDLSAAQVRKDLAYFGQFGSPGVGYEVQHLTAQVKRILGTDRAWNVALIGAGRLGNALLRYQGFEEQGFRIVGVFDRAQELIGQEIGELKILDLESFPELVKEQNIELAILAVPATEAQAVADFLTPHGLKGILNFAPVRLNLPETIQRVEVDLAVQLQQLSYLVTSSELSRRRGS